MIQADRTMTSDGSAWDVGPWHIRRAEQCDRPLIRRFLARVGPDDHRFRFFSGPRKARRRPAVEPRAADDRQREHFLAFADQELVAIGALVADPGRHRAEASVLVCAGQRQKGLSWTLLRHIAQDAAIRGLRTLTTVACQADHGLQATARKAGFTIHDYPGEPALAIVQAHISTG